MGELCENPLKIKTSFRRESIPENEIETIKGIKVYNINTIAIMKANAFSARDIYKSPYNKKGGVTAFLLYGEYRRFHFFTRRLFCTRKSFPDTIQWLKVHPSCMP